MSSENQKLSEQEIVQKIEEKIQEIFDPEFPIVDIRTLGLIYEIAVDAVEKKIKILMTFTSPQCPAGEELKAQVRDAGLDVAPDHVVEVEVTFDPVRDFNKIKDPDLIRMFQ